MFNIKGRNRNLTTEEREFKSQIRSEIIRLAWPCVTELFLLSLIGMVNMIMVGHLGASAISAVGIPAQPVFLSISIFQAFNVGATALVARFTGAGEFKNARDVTKQTLMISFFIGISVSIPLNIFSRQIVIAMGATGDTVQLASMYMKFMAVGVFFQMISTGISSLLRGSGNTRTPMQYNIVSNIVNASLGYVFIYGFWFINGLGVKGAGIAALTANITASGLALYSVFGKDDPSVSLSLREKFRLDFKIIKRILKIGYAAAGEQLALRLGLVIFTRMVIGLGDVAFAAHQLAINIFSLSFNFSQALGMAATSLFGRSLGAKKPELAETYGRTIRRMGMLLSLVAGIVFILFGSVIARIYTSDELLISNVTLILKFVGVIIPAQTSQMIIAGGLRGAGDTRWPLLAIIAGVLGFRLILGVLFIKVLALGLLGAWAAITMDQFARSAVIFFRFRTGKWKYMKI